MFFFILLSLLNTLDFSADFLMIIGGGGCCCTTQKYSFTDMRHNLVVQVLQNIELFSASAVLSRGDLQYLLRHGFL